MGQEKNVYAVLVDAPYSDMMCPTRCRQVSFYDETRNLSAKKAILLPQTKHK